MRPYIRTRLATVVEKVAEPWTSELVADLYHRLNTDRDNIDVLVDVLEALEVFAVHLKEHEQVEAHTHTPN